MLSRNEKGELELNFFDLKIFLGELFAECRDKKEIDWMHKQITICSKNIAKDSIESDLT